MTTIEALLADISAFLRDVEMAETTFGRHAVNDGKFVGRLRSGAGVTVGTIDRVRAYMAAEREKVRGAAEAATARASADTGEIA